MNATQRIYLFLADATLILHFAFVVFVVGGLLLIWLGRLCRWPFVRNLWFRLAHLAAIGVVAAEALSGVICPLTTWENQLRLLAGGETRYKSSFIQHWLHQVMFFEADQRVFTVTYAFITAAVAFSLWFVPPRWRRSKEQPSRSLVTKGESS